MKYEKLRIDVYLSLSFFLFIQSYLFWEVCLQTCPVSVQYAGLAAPGQVNCLIDTLDCLLIASSGVERFLVCKLISELVCSI